MVKTSEIIKSSLQKVLSKRQDVLLLAAKQRAKFEGWLKFELAAALASREDIRNVTIEAPYSTQGRADLSFEANGITWYVEMKTANTNWRAPGLEDKIRPVTRNVDGVITDIAKLREACPPSKGLAVFAVFPIPTRIWEGDRKDLLSHLRRIEDERNLTANVLIDNASFVRLDEHFGVAFFVLEVI